MKPCVIRKIKFFQYPVMESRPDHRDVMKNAEVSLDWWNEITGEYTRRSIYVTYERAMQFRNEMTA